MARKPAVLSTILTLFVLIAGCGEGSGVAEDATVSAYISTPLCQGADQALTRSGGRAGDLQVRAVCVDDTGTGGSRLAAIGAAARRATEDSAAIAYIGSPDPTAARFSEPILEEADIPRIAASSGAAGMERLLSALKQADTSGSLRESLSDELR